MKEIVGQLERQAEQAWERFDDRLERIELMLGDRATRQEISDWIDKVRNMDHRQRDVETKITVATELLSRLAAGTDGATRRLDDHLAGDGHAPTQRDINGLGQRVSYLEQSLTHLSAELAKVKLRIAFWAGGGSVAGALIGVLAPKLVSA